MFFLCFAQESVSFPGRLRRLPTIFFSIGALSSINHGRGLQVPLLIETFSFLIGTGFACRFKLLTL